MELKSHKSVMDREKAVEAGMGQVWRRRPPLRRGIQTASRKPASRELIC